jgi:hypothetical protein
MHGITGQTIERKLPRTKERASDNLFCAHTAITPSLEDLRRPVFEEWHRIQNEPIPITSSGIKGQYTRTAECACGRTMKADSKRCIVCLAAEKVGFSAPKNCKVCGKIFERMPGERLDGYRRRETCGPDCKKAARISTRKSKQEAVTCENS